MPTSSAEFGLAKALQVSGSPLASGASPLAPGNPRSPVGVPGASPTAPSQGPSHFLPVDESKLTAPPKSVKAAEQSSSSSSGSSAALPKPEFDTAPDEDGKHRLSIVVVGHVDSGKSTIMGHLLFDLGLVSKKTMHKFEKECREMGKASFQFAWVLDETDEERERGVTVDVGVTYFET
eukprot:RCo037574